MSRRKKHNFRARIERFCRTSPVPITLLVNIDPSGQQVLMNWKSCKQIRRRQVVDAVCDIAHRWTIYLSVMCHKPDGEQGGDGNSG